MPRKRWVKATVYVGVLILVLACFWFGERVAFGTPTPTFVVSSRSMVPTLHVGDVILVQDGGTFKDIGVGDIIVFKSPLDPDTVIVHRVLKIITDESGRGVITKGDNNPNPDSWIVREEHYIGRVILTLPQIGKVTFFLSPPINYILILIILAVLFISLLGEHQGGDNS